MKRTLIILIAAAGLVGCATSGPPGPPPPPGPAYTPPSAPGAFRDSDFAWSTRSGADSIDGVMDYKPGRYTCKGTSVILAPETPWSRARMRVLYLSTTAAAMPKADVEARTPPQNAADYARYARRSVCDGANHFSFADLPDGPWFVITVATPVSGGEQIAVMRRVVTHGGQTRVRVP